MKNHVEERVKDERLQRLQALINQQQADFVNSLVGKSFDVRNDKHGRQAGQIVGRSPWLQHVIRDEKAGQIGDIVPGRIIRAAFNSLFAEAA